ncbi:MAG: hypothetical protein QW507_00375 [Candidatus Nanoarchaeia archaeon]|nr:hypothetical protein [Candidatus Haiyanarchaeum thermophilum]MCW1302963.1 hypothetical protein [Candidatus Haiyanarchaeum thermophilum]MCW1303641.1 hypothetical protein [Candidatus Haiyanarchaeum thermophilum]MCW1306322.1 hypothetical protein [Candidatus Haiyanarchaeum thermophilum]MCW1307168.1 hypothetical protein [Candidatus Haiyanarchaeum thermophilum]
MELDVIERKVNPFFMREEIKFLIRHDDKTPSREEARKMIASTAGWDESLVIIVELQPKLGKRECEGIAHLYKDRESMLKFEMKHLLVRNKVIEKQEKGEKSGEGGGG